ncbi:hypothetical protein VUJ46_01430 [Chryseobacterium sp. MYb264]|uniref:hypothetical protein n=1 Tax=Chryseobacterium sp. MYb264 TaxID=2745153 RepID=UPI002E1244C7|nr:hypothetical protein VUJ46_01430 [Chryseobacterium sp. MYb264]
MSVYLNVFSQSGGNKDAYTYTVREEYGDLNHDGKMDKLIVKMDTVGTTRPLKLEIFLSQPNGKYALEVSSDQIIEPQYPAEKQGRYNGFQIPDFIIEKGILKMWSEMEGGNITYHFKYNKGNFELIYVEKLTNDATQPYIDENTVFTETTFDLVTGIRIETDERSGSAGTLKVRKKKVFIRPLPKIQDFKFSDKELY